jgi:predicted signal transduction protein with EAL and GGDEF domain
LIALFENWGMYETAKATSQTSAGTLQKQNEIYLESVHAKLDKIKTSAEGLYDSIIDTDGFKVLFDVFSKLIGLTDQFVQGLGGGLSLLGGMGSVAARLFGG